jgi:hypothetical protein
MRFGGIRKPRLGNTGLLNMARSNGWLIQTGRNLNYSISAGMHPPLPPRMLTHSPRLVCPADPALHP